MRDRDHVEAGRALVTRALAVVAFAMMMCAGIGVAARSGQQSGTPQQPPTQQPAQPPPTQEPPPAQQPPATQPPAAGTPAQEEQQPPPRIRTGINFVRVDAIITDRQGNPVLDLKQDEFRIKEDGKPQTIESFSVVKIDAMSQLDGPPPREPTSVFEEQREAQRPDVRLFIILLDDYHVRRGNDMVVRKPLIEFIQNQLAPADMVAIMYPLTPITGLSFTRNRGSLISAIEHFQGRRFDYRPMNEFEEKYHYYPTQTVEMIRNQVVHTALKGAAIKLGGMREGRKSIIFVSEGFTGLLPPQLNDPNASMPGFGNPVRNSPTAQNSDRAEWSAQVDMISDLNLIFTEMNRNNVSIYAVDPRGLAPFEYDINQGVGLQVDKKHLDQSLDTLRALAENTDGRAIINRNDIGKGMQQIIRDASGYYLLGYNSTQAPTDGKFHKVDVEVTRKGVEVRHRKGYWAYTADDVAKAEAPRVEAPPAITEALATLAEPPRGRPARFWIGTAKGENGKSNVTFAWEPVAAAPGERRTTDDKATNVLLTAVAPDGRPLFRGRVPDQNAAAAPAAAPVGSAAPASASFDVPPGRMQLRVTVQNAAGQVVDSSTSEVNVPDYTTPQISFGTPRVFRARTPRDVQAIKSNAAAAVPTADRTFSRTERALIRVDAYSPGTAPPAISARLLNRTGGAVVDVPVQMSGNTGELEMAFSSLAAGEYLIELNAKSEAGAAQQLVAFRIK